MESGNRFKGVFNNQELLAYNVTPKFSNEFKGPEEFTLMECRIGIRTNNFLPSKPKQLVMMIAEYR